MTLYHQGCAPPYYQVCALPTKSVPFYSCDCWSLKSATLQLSTTKNVGTEEQRG